MKINAAVSCGALCPILLLFHSTECFSQTETEILQAYAKEQSPRLYAEREMKDREVVAITDEWIRDNPGRLTVSISTAMNNTTTCFFEFNSHNDALFQTTTTIVMEGEPRKGEPIPFHVENQSTTTSPSKKLKFSVSIPRTTREIEILVQIKELRRFTIQGKSTFGSEPAVDILFANAREPDATRYNLRVLDFTSDKMGSSMRESRSKTKP